MAGTQPARSGRIGPGFDTPYHRPSTGSGKGNASDEKSCRLSHDPRPDPHLRVARRRRGTLRIAGQHHQRQRDQALPADQDLHTPDGSARTLAVLLHGALSRGGDADYIIGTARISATYGAVGVAMARPGYTLDGRTSTGVATRNKHPSYWHRAEETAPAKPARS